MKQVFFIVLTSLLTLPNLSKAQSNFEALDIPIFAMEPVNNKDLQEVYSNETKENRAPKFAHPFKVNIDQEDFLQVIGTPNTSFYGEIYSEGAKSLNLGFEQFLLPEGSQFFIYSHMEKEWIGPFEKEKREVLEYWTPIIAGDRLTLKVTVPTELRDQLNVELSSVNHDFVGFGGAVSGSCNLDVVCGAADGYPEVDLYRDIIRSVGVYTINGTWFCSGALINTADQSCRPYFLTANHCLNSNAAANGVVIYWNFENSYCRPPGSADSGSGGDGPLDQFNSGTDLIASNATSDFTLLEVSGDIDADVNAFLAGWNRERKAPPAAIAIHHPSTDEKRISFEFDPLAISDYLSTNVNNNEHYLWVDDWDVGTTEPGSSGSPLFDEDKRIIGQLSGGFAACGNEDSDWYGFMASNFSLETNPNNGIGSHLDPNQSGVIVVDGEEYNTCGLSNFAIIGLMDTVCTDTDTLKFKIINSDPTEDLSLTVETGSENPTVTFSNGDVLASGDSTILMLTDLADYGAGVNSFELDIDQGGASITRELLFVRMTVPSVPTIISPVSGASLLAPFDIEWQDVGTSYTLTYSLNSDFSDSTEVELTEASFRVENFDLGERYYFEIIAHNLCGPSLPLVVDYEIRDAICYLLDHSEDVSISDNSTSEIPFGVDIGGGLAYLELRNVDIAHTYVGDLTIELTANGQSITLLDEECGSSNNVLLGFKDDGLADIPCPPSTGLDYQAETPFSDWYGRTDIDKFNFVVSDGAQGDEGQIQNVSLFYCTEKNQGQGYISEDFSDEMYQLDVLTVNLEIDTSILGSSDVSLTASLPADISFDNFTGFFDKNLASFNLVADGAAPGNYQIDFVAESSLAIDMVRLDLTVLPCLSHPDIAAIPDTLRTYYYDFNWSDQGSASYNYVISDNRIPQMGNVFDSGNTNNTNHLSTALPNDQWVYISVESDGDCLIGPTSVDSFYVEYNYAIDLSQDSLVICPGDTLFIDLSIGDRYFDSLSLDIIGDDFNEFTFWYNQATLFDDNRVRVSFTPENSQVGLGYTFQLLVSDFVSFSDSRDLYVFVDWDEVEATLTSPPQDSMLIIPPVLFTWDGPPVDGVLEISKNESFDPIVYSYDVSGVNEMLFEDMLDNTTEYFWRVRTESSCDIAVSETFSFTTDIIESTVEPNKDLFNVFPNPTFGDLNYLYTGPGEVEFMVRDIQGRIVIQKNATSNVEGIINMKNLSPGMYTLEVLIGKTVLHKKINKL